MRREKLCWDESKLSRRDFLQTVALLGAMGYIDGHTAAMAMEAESGTLGWLAQRTAGAEGTWKLTDIEGEVPRELEGTLFRTAPGNSESFGVRFQHLFDGDAFVSAYDFEDGAITLRARFANTPQRAEEQAVGKMLYSEYGTMRPSDGPKGQYDGKNQPSVNIIPWDGRLLGLSEGGWPSEFDRKTLEWKSYWNFYGTLNPQMSFTAHPKFDPVAGVGYCYGKFQGPGMALKVYRMESTGKLTELYSHPQPGYYMIHDMLMSREHLIFVIPPVKYDLGTLLSGRGSVADAQQYFESEPLQFLVFRRDGTGEPITIEQPPNMVYHNGNAFERDGKLYLDTLLSPDNSVNEMLRTFGSDRPVTDYQTARLTRIAIDLDTRAVVGRDELDTDQEFPRFDIRKGGENARYLYCAKGDMVDSPLAMNMIVRNDLHKGTSETLRAEKGRVYGEPVFVPQPGSRAEDRGWLLSLGYDADRDETYLEINDAGSMEFAARVWTGNHLPLGFHGNFQSGWHITA